MTSSDKPFRYVGQSVARLDAFDKVTGRTRYVDDLCLPGMLFGKTVRSTIACGKILSIEFPPEIPWNEYTIVDCRDLPGMNIVKLIVDDQPVLCDGEVRHRGEPILLIAHPDRQAVAHAARSVRINYQESPGLFKIGAGEVQKEIRIETGDLEREFSRCDLVLERTYRTGAQEHVYIEPQGMLAQWNEEGLTVQGSLQCPYYVQAALKYSLNLNDDEVNVIQTATGGGFGGKEEFPSMLAIHAALLARKSGSPVKMIYDRQEDMAFTTKRHPSESRIRVSATKDGILRALDFDFRLDGGAYITLSPVVLSRGVLHAFGCYRWQAARIHGRSHFTNSPPYGAFRGFGAPQSLFALETHLSLLAEELGMDPAELRRKNFLRQGDRMPTGQVMTEDPNLENLMERAIELSGYRQKRQEYSKKSGRGIGISTFMHGGGFTGSGETYLASKAALATRKDGKVEILISNVDMGQGTETVFCQMVAEVLHLPLESVVFHQPETRVVPNSGPTVASRTCMIVGRLIQKAAEGLRERLGDLSVPEHYGIHGEVRLEVQYEPPPDIIWDDHEYQGSAYAAYAWSCNIAEVSVDPLTAEVTVNRITSTADIGTVLNPTLSLGQIEGGIAQAVGWAIGENVVLREGVMANAEMMNYAIPTAVDMPAVQVEFMPQPYPEGGFGAKGVGELPLDGPAPAIAAAVSSAIGKEICSLPILPEELV